MSVTVISDTGVNNLYVNANTGSALIVTTDPIPSHNFLDGKQGGGANQYYHLTANEYSFLVTGDVLRPSDSGLFYATSNPSGFITSSTIASGSSVISNIVSISQINYDALATKEPSTLYVIAP